MKAKTKKCEICYKKIYLDRDTYIIVQYYIKGKHNKDRYYHTKCFLHKIETGQKVNQLMGMTSSLFKRTDNLLTESGY